MELNAAVHMWFVKLYTEKAFHCFKATQCLRWGLLIFFLDSSINILWLPYSVLGRSYDLTFFLNIRVPICTEVTPYFSVFTQVSEFAPKGYKTYTYFLPTKARAYLSGKGGAKKVSNSADMFITVRVSLNLLEGDTGYVVFLVPQDLLMEVVTV